MRTKIVIIEDEPRIRAKLAQFLREEILPDQTELRFEVKEAEDGISGLELIYQFRPDLVVCDILMPRLNGHEVLRALRHDPAMATIPFIFLTGNIDQEAVREGMELGADDYLPKPFTYKSLLGAINTRLAKYASQQSLAQQHVTELNRNLSHALPHELRTPLSSILMYSSLLIENFKAPTFESKSYADSSIQLKPTEVVEMLEGIYKGASRLQHLAENYWLYAQLEMEQTVRAITDSNKTATTEADPNNMPLGDINTTFANAIQFIKITAREQADKVKRASDLRLEVMDSGSLPKNGAELLLAISEERLIKLAEEFINNALKFSRPDSPIEIKIEFKSEPPVLQSEEGELSKLVESGLRPAEGWLVFRVTDHGRGLTAEQLAHIGEAYNQFDRKHYEQQGMGLGFAIAKNMVQLGSGELTIASKFGESTTVQAALPIFPAK